VITLKWYTTLSKQKYDQLLKLYILKKTKWHLRLFDKVDWEAHQRAFRKQTRFQQIGLAKIIHNLANTNRQNSLLYNTNPLCPLCEISEETFEHVLTCSDARASNHRDEQLQQLKRSLGVNGTPTVIINYIMQGFQHWINPISSTSRAPTYSSVNGPEVLLTAAYHEQFHELGWHQCSLGRISTIWVRAVETFIRREQQTIHPA